MNWQIAIDGPAGAGKSTIAKEVAKRLNFAYVDTGAMYRAVTLKAINLNINMEDEAEYKFLEFTTIDFNHDKLYLDGIDVSKEIRSFEVTNNVSLVSKYKYVREKLVALQQSLVNSKNIIMDGRDIGTVVLPKANLKIFLVASVAERATRRLKEREENGSKDKSLNETIIEIQERDFKDSNREISPLAKATDAIEIDTSLLSVNEVVEMIISLVMERGYKMENVKTEVENVETIVAKATKEKKTSKTKAAVEAVEVAPVETTVEKATKEKKPRKTKAAVEAEEVAPVETTVEKATKEKKPRKTKAAVEAEEVAEVAEEVTEVAAEEVVEVAEEVTEDVAEEVTAEEVTEEVVAEEVTAEEVVNVEEATETPEQTEAVRELQLVEGTVLEVYEATAEAKNKKGEVIKKAKEERVLIKLDNGQEGLLFRKDVAKIEDDEDLADIFMEDDRVKVIVKRVYPDGGKVLLSTALVEKRDEIKKFEETIKNHGVFTAKVVKSIKVGLILEYDNYTCLLPNSQIDINLDNAQALIDTELEVAPIRVDYNRIRLIVSHKVAKAIKNRSEKHEFIKNVEVGQVFDGVVKNIESYGAFVEIAPGVEGLLHISEIEHSRVVKVEKVLNVGDAVKVQVIKVEKEHIGLSRKALLPNYWKEFIEQQQVDNVIQGTVIEINKSGVVLNLTEQIQGFLPKSEFSWERDVFIEDIIKLGDVIDVKIIELDLNKKRIILSRKKLEENPWDNLKVRSGDTVSATVVKVLQEGVKVTVNGASGFMPKNNYAAGTVFTEGQVLEAKVKVVDPIKTRLIVSIREDYSLDKNSVNKYLKSQERVTSTFGDFIDIDKFKKSKR